MTFSVPTHYKDGAPKTILPKTALRPPEAGVPILPRLLTKDTFEGLNNGYLQQYALQSLIAERNFIKLRELRPDMHPEELLTQKELNMSFLVREYTTKPMDSATREKYFALIYSFIDINPSTGKKATKEEVTDILEEEAKRETEFPNSLFAPDKDIGSITAARRYLANLAFADCSELWDSTRLMMEKELSGIAVYNGELILIGVPFE